MHGVELGTLSHEVRVFHDSILSASHICRALLAAAFEVCNATTVDAAGVKIQELSFAKDNEGWLERAMNRLTSDSEALSLSHLNCFQFAGKNLRGSHLANCAACREEEFSRKNPSTGSATYTTTSSEEVEAHSRQAQEEKSNSADRACYRSNKSECDLASTYDGSFTRDISNGSERGQSYQHSMILHVGGMTCEADVRLITQALENLPNVQNIHASLDNSRLTLTCIGNEGQEGWV